MSRLRPRLRDSDTSTFREPGGRWIWLVPIFVFMVVSVGVALRQLDYAMGLALGVVVIVFIARRPELGLLGLIVFLPFQQVVFSWFFHAGISLQLVRQAGSWKEGLGIGVVIAGIIGFRKARKKLDLLDKIAIAYILFVLLFAVFPELFSSGIPASSNVRSLGFRQTAGFVLLLLGARHAQLPPNFGRIAAKAVMISGSIVAACAVYEFFFSDSWNNFLVNTIDFPQYKFDVFAEGSPFITDLRTYGELAGVRYTRVGSVLVNPLILGFYLLLPFAFAIERTVRDGLRSMAGAVVLLTGAAIIFTQTRAAVIGALVIAMLAVRPGAGKTTSRRLEYGFLLSILIALALPVAVVSGLAERSTSAVAGQEESATDHWEAQVNGFRGLAENPLGLGLGTSAGVGLRFSEVGAFVTENYYLQIGIELGIVGMLLFIALTLVLIKRLNHAVKRVPDMALGAMRGAVIGLAIGAVLLHTWNDFPVAWVAWALAGAVLGNAERVMRDEDSWGETDLALAPHDSSGRPR
jgi:hypothetical protein